MSTEGLICQTHMMASSKCCATGRCLGHESTTAGCMSLTLAQFFLAWAWNQNDFAKHFLDGEAVANARMPANAITRGVVSAVSAAKSLVHGKLLMSTGANASPQGRRPH